LQESFPLYPFLSSLSFVQQPSTQTNAFRTVSDIEKRLKLLSEKSKKKKYSRKAKWMNRNKKICVKNEDGKSINPKV
jgi:hypothetical protein